MATSEYAAASATLCNCTAIRQAARHMTRFYNACLADVGLYGPQYIMLLFLSRHGAVTMAEMAQALAIDRTTISHNLRPLERDGFVSISIGKEDKRSRVIALTATGKRSVQKGRRAWQRAHELFEAKFGSEKARAMRAMMAQIVATELDDLS
ncbi:MarR family winged helix-turn-helix transcriptional regulator [Paraburkholderia megapolitana]|uniref:MarR family winged helix-turn-helix transcriptional regulator n=1 Tax=Paraburkholderia megapolitana TaxID=420953 RepID=UPI0038BB12C6